MPGGRSESQERKAFMSGILCLDRGNRGLKGAFFRGGEIAERWRIDSDDHTGAVRSILEASSPAGIAFSSVIPDWTGVLKKLCAPGMNVLEAGTELELPFELLIDEPEKLGPDRLAAASGARALGLRNAVIVDCGTAVTVDVLTEEGFRGGAIFPGYGLILRALKQGTAALPGIELSFSGLNLPGRNTSEAMLAGTVIGSAGAVKELIQRSFSSFGSVPPVIVTGGGAGELVTELGLAVREEPDLIFLGLHLLYEKNIALP